ncbi:MAG: hypothetical protein D6808_03540 [Candidatus Dadabacteria bacterium]|nr:MAG: hypothetical protein D6808_03540 [Candidatus Dadabacteria bacterium]
MKRPYHWALLSVFPAIFIASNNIGAVSLFSLLQAVAIFFFCGFVLACVFSLAFRSFLKGTLVASILISAVSFYTPLWLALGIWLKSEFVSDLVLPYGSAAIILFAIVMVVRAREKKLLPWNTFFNYFSAIIVVCAVANGFLKAYNTPNVNAPKPLALSPSKTPDVFYIILDGYARGDTLKEIYGFDNKDFLNFLRNEGFYIAERCTTNYPQTISSIASSLNMDYISSLAPSVPPDYIGRLPLMRLIRKGRVIKTLRSLGYTIVTASTGVSDIEIPGSDRVIKPPGGNPVIEEIMSQIKLPFAMDYLSGLLYKKHRDRILATLDSFREIGSSKNPVFYYAHIMLPHPPFIFRADGTFSPPRKRFSYGDGNFFGDRTNYKKKYIAQLSYLNNRMERIVSTLLSRDTKPIIIVQSDHGSGSTYNMTKLNRDSLKERFGILCAFYFPDHNYSLLYSDISPVNIFRVVFNSAFRGGLPMLPDRSYFVGYFKHYNPVDVSEVVKAVHDSPRS